MEWHDDGVVVEVLLTSCVHDGLSLSIGTIRVQYGKFKCFEWIAPEGAGKFLRPSDRPAPPPALIGDLSKETHDWIFTEWHVRHFELNRGLLQWWMCVEDAKRGVKPNGSFALLDFQMLPKGTAFLVRTASSKGTTYHFDAGAPENAQRWFTALRLHADYCERLRKWTATAGWPRLWA